MKSTEARAALTATVNDVGIASPPQAVSIQSESCSLLASPIQYQCDYCRETLTTRYFCGNEKCNINLRKSCLPLHPTTEHPIQELRTGQPASSGQPSGYVLGEVSESEAIPDDPLELDKSDAEESRVSDKPRGRDMQGQGGLKRSLQPQQPLAHRWMASTMPEKLPEQLLLAKLVEQPGAMVTFDKKDVIKVIRHIQNSRDRLALLERSVGAPDLLPRHDNARPSRKRSSVVQSPGTGNVGSDTLRGSDLSNSENSNDEEPAPNRGLHTRKRGRLRDLLEFDVPRSKPEHCNETRQNRRWTLEDKRRLKELKGKGWDNDRIAAELNRSSAAILQQWAKQMD
ncbi:hypothetical protein VB005_00564 [Metarhizium brunneum]